MKKGQSLSIANTLKAHYESLDKKDERPNILIIMTDQQRYDTIAALGYDYMHTPNIDRLANEGCSYVNAYTPNPICCPARHSFITGLSCAGHGIADNDFNARLNPSVVSFPRILSQNGYVTEAIGKMHFQPCREHHGFQRLKLMEEVPENRYDDDYLMYLKDNGYGDVQNIHGVRNLLFFLPQNALLPKKHHGTTWVTDRGLEFLDENAGKRPFLLYLSYIAPHPPFNGYKEYSKYYESAGLPHKKNTKTPLPEMAKENKMFGDIANDAYLRRMKEVYFGMISQIDEQIGRVLNKLEANNELDNTLIIFTSDHGEMLGDYGLYQKFLPYESSARIPFVMRYPKKIASGIKKDDFADLTDIFPTVLDAAELSHMKSDDLVGESLIAPDGIKDRKTQYISYSEGSRRWACVRDQRYKYIYYYGGGIKVLFDLINDPDESNNLLYKNADDSIQAIADHMHQKLVQYEKAQWKPEYIVGDDLAVFEPYEAVCTRNRAFPQFLRNISDEEKAHMNDFLDEVILAVEKEPVVKFEELDYKAFQKNGNFTDEDISRLFKREKVKEHSHDT